MACVVITLDVNAYANTGSADPAADPDLRDADADLREADAKRARALHHALAEYEIKTFAITPGLPLGEILAG